MISAGCANCSPRLEAANRQGEYYLTDIIAMMVAKGWPVGAFQIEDYRVGLGVNDRVHLAEAAALCRERINGRLMREGSPLSIPPAPTSTTGFRWEPIR